MTFRTPEQVKLTALRAECAELLAQCTDAQQAFFLRVFPGGVEKQTEEKLCTAITLCQRTIAKNEKGRGATAEQGKPEEVQR